MRKICTYPGCNVAVEVDDFDRSSPRCQSHPSSHVPKRVYQHQYRNGKHVYSTYQWKKVRKLYAASQPLCEHCLRFDIVTPLAVVDHIKEISDGGELYDFKNLMSLCHTCHNQKTAKEKKKRNKTGASMSDF